ncbi:MAG: helicase c2 [Microbacterium sp.]|nr:helicase c2 [Microbacterium sp.]
MGALRTERMARQHRPFRPATGRAGCGDLAFRPAEYVVMEAKTGATANVIWKKDINQLAGSVNWAQGEYGADATVIPLVVHPSHVVERAGTPPPNCRSINRADMKELKKA